MRPVAKRQVATHEVTAEKSPVIRASHILQTEFPFCLSNGENPSTPPSSSISTTHVSHRSRSHHNNVSLCAFKLDPILPAMDPLSRIVNPEMRAADPRPTSLLGFVESRCA